LITLKKGVIAITQPRRVAAISLACRVSQEFGTQLGQKVCTFFFYFCALNMMDVMILKLTLSEGWIFSTI